MLFPDEGSCVDARPRQVFLNEAEMFGSTKPQFYIFARDTTHGRLYVCRIGPTNEESRSREFGRPVRSGNSRFGLFCFFFIQIHTPHIPSTTFPNLILRPPKRMNNPENGRCLHLAGCLSQFASCFHMMFCCPAGCA